MLAASMADGAALFGPQSDSEVLAKAREEIAKYHDLNHRALDGVAVPESVRPGCDVTLSHMGLTTLPAELIDIVKNDVARLALDNNRLPSLSGLSPRFHECSRLRYLVMRNNQMREFPQAILSVPTLELLDLKGNKITSLPEDLSRLRNLRVFSIYANRVTHIPLCVANMPGLVHFAARKNPIQFPAQEEWIVDAPDADPRDKQRDDQKVTAETKKLKDALAAHSRRERLRAEADSELSEENVETPRPARRKTSGRFPIKPTSSATDLKDGSVLVSPPLISPALHKPLPMSLRSTARLPTQPQTATFRPTVVPFMGLSERNRSNSESQMSNVPRAKRFGMMARKPVAQASPEVDLDKRLSHLRGLSHGSALQNDSSHEGKIKGDTGSPGSPNDGDRNATAFRRLSILPEGKRKSQAHDPTIDLIEGVCYALDQISIPIQHVILAVRDGRRVHLERSLQVGQSYVAELQQNLSEVTSHDEEIDEAEQRRRKSALKLSCLNCIRAFQQIFRHMQHEIRILIVHNSPRRVRTLMHMLHASLVEVRNACAKIGVRFQRTPKPLQRSNIQPRYVSPDLNRPSTSMRVRDDIPLMSSRTTSRSNSRVRQAPTSSVALPPPFSAKSRNGSMTSLNGVMQASESFPPYPSGPIPVATTRMTRSNTLQSVDESDEDAQFDDIYEKLVSATDFAAHALPKCSNLILETTRHAIDRGATDDEVANYKVILERCTAAKESSEALKGRLFDMRMKAREVRLNLEFWQLCTSFTRAYALFAARVKDCYHGPVSLLPDEIKNQMKPLQRAVKEVSKAINDSVWGSLAATRGQQSAQIAHRSMTNIAALNQANIDAALGVPRQSLRGRPVNSRSNTVTASTLTQQQRQHPQLSLATRGVIPPPNPHDPLSAASTHSAGDTFPLGLGLNGLGLVSSMGYPAPVPGPGLTSKTGVSASSLPPPPPTSATSGYVTPLPATPLSAALGPAASATVPLPVSLPLSNLAAGVTTGLGGPTALGGLLPTSSTVNGAGPLTAIPPPSLGPGLLPNPPVAVSGLVGPSNIDKQGMVSGLQGYLSAAGAVPLSGVPLPPIPMPNPPYFTTLTNGPVVGQTVLNQGQGQGQSSMAALQQMPLNHAPAPPVPMTSQMPQGYRPVTPTAGVYDRIETRPRSLSTKRDGANQQVPNYFNYGG